MEFGQLNNLAISVEKQGPSDVRKAIFPLRYGKYSEIKTSEYEFLFNLNGEIFVANPPVQSSQTNIWFFESS